MGACDRRCGNPKEYNKKVQFILQKARKKGTITGNVVATKKEEK